METSNDGVSTACDATSSKFVELATHIPACGVTPPTTELYSRVLLRLVNTWRRMCDPGTAYHSEDTSGDYDTVGWLPPGL